MASTNPRYTIRNELTERTPQQSSALFVKDEKGAIQPNIGEAFSQHLWKINVFSDHELNKRVPKPVIENLKAAIRDGTVVDGATADVVAQAMKEWYAGTSCIFSNNLLYRALSRGCTHYTHWFQPIRSGTAEKHDSFTDFFGPDRDLRMEFSGESLLRAEPGTNTKQYENFIYSSSFRLYFIICMSTQYKF
jgi:glutamine synthetase type III